MPVEGEVTPLTRQPTIYSLTFDEFQNSVGGIGKDFGSMNMDEFLKNIWSAEENHEIGSITGEGSGAAYLQRQGSLTIPRTLSLKTVDEVWQDMLMEYDDSAGGVVGCSGSSQRQPTLGEITLEDFLAKAGVVRDLGFEDQHEKVNGDLNTINVNLPLNINFGGGQQEPLQLQMVTSNGIQSTVLHGIGNNGVSFSRGLPLVASEGLKGNGGITPTPYTFSGLSGRKTAGVEKVLERRQKRMIKNRESAARSRARKQAYTRELEEEVARLKEENQKLHKKQAVMRANAMQKNLVREMTNQQTNGVKRACLRRMNTGPW